MAMGVDEDGKREGEGTRASASATWTTASICSWKPGGSTVLVLAPLEMDEEPLPGDVGTGATVVSVIDED